MDRLTKYLCNTLRPIAHSGSLEGWLEFISLAALAWMDGSL